MNKFVATCLEAQLCLFDARTQHLTKGFAARVAQLRRDATLWGVQHVPQVGKRRVCCLLCLPRRSSWSIKNHAWAALLFGSYT